MVTDVEIVKEILNSLMGNISKNSTNLDDFRENLNLKMGWKKEEQYRKKLNELSNIKIVMNGTIPNSAGGDILKKVCFDFGQPYRSVYGEKYSYIQEKKDLSLQLKENEKINSKLNSIVYKSNKLLRDDLCYVTWFFEIDGDFIMVNDSASQSSLISLSSVRYCDIIMDVEKMGIEKAFKILDYIKQLMIEEMKNEKERIND